MKALDAILENGAREGRSDLFASRSMSREVDNSGRFQFLDRNFSERQRLTVASNYFAIACPLMPVGVLGIFMLLEKLSSSYDEKHGMAGALESEEAQRQRGEFTQAIYVAAMKKKLEAERKAESMRDGMICSRPVDGIVPVGDRRPSSKPRKEAALMLEGKRSDRISGPSLLSRNPSAAHAEAGKLVKAKMQLQSYLEDLEQEQDYGAVCRVSARLELLDKALKKLGC